MSNIIAFPVNGLGDGSELADINTLAQERMEGVRDQIQDISRWLIAIQDKLAKEAMASAGLPETAGTNLPADDE